MADTYKYRALSRSKREIRLLELRPKDEDERFKLIPVCHIVHATLNDVVKYSALSYVWGDGTAKRVILVDNSLVRVNLNLYDAMMALRPLEKSFVLWIDFLCINQADAGEKSWQVALMADIYQRADRVVAWLGRADSDSDSTMDYLNTFGAEAEACGLTYNYGLHENLWRGLASQPQEFRSQGSSSPMMADISAHSPSFRPDLATNLFYSISGWHDQDKLLPILGIRRLFTRPWWSRVWVLQEITLPEQAHFLCGTKTITRWRCSAALNAYCALREVVTTRFCSDPKSMTMYHWVLMSHLFQHRPSMMLSSWRLHQYDEFPLVALLKATCVGTINPKRHGPHDLEATDPRDKIFALLAIAADKKQLQGLGVVPDYSKSCRDVYVTAMVAFLQQGHMSLLSCCQSPRTVPGLPSWAPDWSQGIADMLQDIETDHLTLYPKFRASGGDSLYPEISIVKKNGVVDAISVVSQTYDEILEVGAFPGRVSSREVPVSETSSWPVQWLAEVLRLSYCSKDHDKHFSKRLLSAARASIGGVRQDHNLLQKRVGDEVLPEALGLLQDGIRHVRNGKIGGSIARLNISGADALEQVKVQSNNAAPINLGSAIMGKSLGRLPSVTKLGHLVLSCEHVRRGDRVALIMGAQVPFLLRLQGNGHYELIGEAYVDGIMDGEAMKPSQWGRICLV